MNIATYCDTKLLSRKAYFIAMACIFAAVSLLYALSFQVKYNQVQTRKDASGFEHHYASRFFYFYYYTGFFPLATLDTNLTYTKEAAYAEIEQDGGKLIMEYKHWARLGEHARIFCYLPDAILKGSAKDPAIRLFNAIFWLLALLSLYRGFYHIQKPLIGLLMCVMILATPYFHYELFRQVNIFALQSSAFFIALGLLLPVVMSHSDILISKLIPLFSACVVIAFCSEIRNEISVVFVSILFMILLLTTVSIKQKLLLVVMATLFFAGTKKCIQFYFEKKFDATAQVVTAKGGHVYTGKRISGHRLWHPVFCGLGDYDKKYGYAWNDTVAYEYAVPVLNRDYHLNLKYSGELYTDNYYDSAKLYYVKFDEIAEYEQVVKEKVLHDIKADPLWYVNIIFKRILKVCTTTLPFPLLGFVTIIGIVFFVVKKKWFYLKLILIAMPLSATSILIYSGKGATYNSMFGYFMLAIMIYECCFYFKMKKKALQ